MASFCLASGGSKAIKSSTSLHEDPLRVQHNIRARTELRDTTVGPIHFIFLMLLYATSSVELTSLATPTYKFLTNFNVCSPGSETTTKATFPKEDCRVGVEKFEDNLNEVTHSQSLRCSLRTQFRECIHWYVADRCRHRQDNGTIYEYIFTGEIRPSSHSAFHRIKNSCPAP